MSEFFLVSSNFRCGENGKESLEMVWLYSNKTTRCVSIDD